MIRPTHATVDLNALAHNYRAIVRHLAAGAAGVGGAVGAGGGAAPPAVIAVIKANAYGHGAAPVALALERAAAAEGAADGATPLLACADIEEGIELRAAGVQAPILVFGALSVSDLAGLFEHRLTPTVSSPGAARALAAAAAERGTRLHVHLKIDTGMHRFGFRDDNLRETLPEVVRSPHLAVDAVYTHFATAELTDHSLFGEQRERFEAVRAAAGAHGLAGVRWHAANSAALLRDPRTWYDAVRPGLLLYGVAPPPLRTGLDLRPVMALRSRVVAVKGMWPGETAGYGARFVADRPMRVAIVPAGYADGLDLRLAGRGTVLIGGARADIVTVSMDSLTIDVTAIPAEPGEDVVILGEQAGGRITAVDAASAVGTVPHEVLCRIGARIERTYYS